MDFSRIAIIGGGNIGCALAEGIVMSGILEPSSLIVTRKRLHLIDYLKSQGVQTSLDNVEAVKDADLVILAIKPKNLVQVVDNIKDVLTEDKVIVSMIAGVSIADLQKYFSESHKIFRAMPNTAISICESITCLSISEKFEREEQMLSEFFGKLGIVVPITEDLMESATVLGSTGIAFALRYMRAATQGGIEIGFSAEIAHLITAQTVKGAAALLLSKHQHPESEIDKVTTPQGITISGLNEMEHKGFSSAVIKGITTSYIKVMHIKNPK